MIGTLAILNVGAGDTKLSFDKTKPEEVKRASAAVGDMLKRGFAIFIEVGKRQGEPIYQRVKKFDPKKAEYIIAGAPDNAEVEAPPKRAKSKERRIEAAGTKAVAVARSAGG